VTSDPGFDGPRAGASTDSDLGGAVVTGGTSGIGLAIVERLTRDGYQVVALSRSSRDEFSDVVARAEEAGLQPPVFVAADVVDPKQLAKARDEVTGILGKHLRVVVASAGINIRKSALEVDEAEVRRMLETNVLGTFLAFQIFAPLATQAHDPRFIAIGSVSGRFGMKLRAPYSATKAALSGLVQSLAIEWGAGGTTVNAVAPGVVDTPLTRGYVESFPDRAQSVIERTPAGRLGTPEDVANVVSFLASAETGFITGQTIYVDGGLSVGIETW
jgi:NAD(P)-dependent dehydrogenase (short-subunit alcohol dehydrogenase family)